MRIRRMEAGVSLVEVMIAAALMGIGVLGAVASYNYISRAIQSSKARSLATNLAHEKMQIIMQKSYYEILVTTAPTTDTRVNPNISYDALYFVPETILEGSISFIRETLVQGVVDNSGTIQPVPSNDAADTGMRQVTVSVLWQSGVKNGEYNVLTIQNIINNPSTVMYNALAKGTVSDTTGALLNSAMVNVAENLSWRDSTDAAGNYLIHLSSGSYDLIAAAQGYYSKRVGISVAPGGTVTTNFALTKIATGTIQGTAWMNQHLVISQVVATTGTAGDIEYVELYNPTTFSIFIGSNSVVNSPSIAPIIWDQSNSLPGSGSSAMRHLYYVNSTVPSQGYYLISNTGSPSGTSTSCRSFVASARVLLPDACWKLVQAPTHAFVQGDAGGFSLGNTNSYTGSLNFMSANWPAARIDSIGWSDSAAGHAAPSNAVETTGMSTAAGVQPNEQFVRKTSTGSVNTSFGNAYDAGINSTDFMDVSAIVVPPHTSTYTAQAPLTGTPAVGAIASVSDSISAPSTTTLVGNPPYGWFSIVGVATGTWSVFLDSGTSSAEIGNVTVVTNTVTSISNAATAPPWLVAGINSVILSTYGVTGLITGTATDIFGAPITVGPTINVTAGGVTKAVNASGYYSIRVNTGTYNVVANPNNSNSLYESETTQNVTITAGDTTSRVNFLLSQGGQITGWVTRDGVNPLPGIAVTAADGNGLVQQTEVSASNGRFTLVNLTTGTYTISPVLDPKETASPTSAATTIASAGSTAWSSTFTVTGAMGTISGTVSLGTQPIQTGVLILVSTSTFTSGPPVISTAMLTSSSLYADSSHEDGTYSIEVRGSSTTTYNIYAYYQRLSGGSPVISSSTLTNVTVNAGFTTGGKNFTW